MGGLVTEEQAISHAQYLDLVYSPFHTLCNLIPHAPQPSNDPTKIFIHCQHYNICLNPHKFIFVVESVRLLGFIVSIFGIRVDPLKVEAIINLPPPVTINQLQKLQQISNFLRWFIVNCIYITKGFILLLKNGIPFIWDEQSQRSFDRLKHILTSTPLLKPPNYNQYFILYLTTSDTTIKIVLVQTDEDHNEHAI
jgi:hypothetical protein